VALTQLAHSHVEHRVAIAEAGAIPPLVAMLGESTGGAQDLAAGALVKIAHPVANRMEERF